MSPEDASDRGGTRVDGTKREHCQEKGRVVHRQPDGQWLGFVALPHAELTGLGRLSPQAAVQDDPEQGDEAGGPAFGAGAAELIALDGHQPLPPAAVTVSGRGYNTTRACIKIKT